MHFLDLPDRAALDQLDDAAIVVRSVNLGAHLRDELVLFGKVREHTGFVYGVCQWLFAVDMLLHSQRHRGCRSVRVVRRADEHGVDLVGFSFQHDSIVAILASTGVNLPGSLQ